MRIERAPFLLAGWLAATAGMLAPSSCIASNEGTVLVLHAEASGRTCASVATFDCDTPADVSVTAGAQAAIFLFVREFDNLSGVQCRFEWPPGWTLGGWGGGCAPGQINAVSPGGGSGELTTAFNNITGAGSVTPIGFFSVTAGPGGCLTIGESSYPFATHVIDVSGGTTAIPLERRGSVCVGGGGADGCALGQDFDDSTWGAIKAGFNR